MQKFQTAGSAFRRQARVLFAMVFTLCAGAQSFALEYSEQRTPCAAFDEHRRPFFGDLHVHTRHSLDASTQGTRTSPAQAYEFARGQEIGIQPWDSEGQPMRSLQLRRPLDFAMVSDHAELIGEVRMCNTPEVEGYNSWQCMLYRHIPRGAYYLFNYMATMQQSHLGMCGEQGEKCREAGLVPWVEMQAAAETNYDRSGECEFTAFVGYEWTGMKSDNGGNLHRNVVFRNAEVPNLPVSFIDAPGASLLWQALDQQCISAGGNCDTLIIPHNSNLSAGHMFSGELDVGGPMTSEYARQRARFEPLVEVMQHKGASECYYAPALVSDELCAFEQQPKDNIAGYDAKPTPQTGFVRQVLADGLGLEAKLGTNPYQFGVIASTDTHLGAPGAVEEDRFLGHGGAGVPARGEIPPGLPDKLEYNPGGLAVVWAEENSRDSLFSAMRRREAYGTSGPRISSRFFAGWGYSDDLCQSADRIEHAYSGGVPMGGLLTDAPAADSAPVFLLAASQDPGTADSPGMPLQRIQVIKGWIDENGETQEMVLNVAGNPDNGAKVDLKSCETSGEGFSQLCAVWRDEDFDPAQRAFYYSRVVENPSCRWSQRQCVAARVDCSDPDTIGEGFAGCCAIEHRPVIQERAWSSPIWYTPPEA
ncbi:MAG: DUF3604 domain-containing protein [Halioglobus sp.]